MYRTTGDVLVNESARRAILRIKVPKGRQTLKALFINKRKGEWKYLSYLILEAVELELENTGIELKALKESEVFF